MSRGRAAFTEADLNRALKQAQKAAERGFYVKVEAGRHGISLIPITGPVNIGESGNNRSVGVDGTSADESFEEVGTL